MQKLVESCLAEVNQEMQEAEKEYRDRVLVEMGIAERIYSDDTNNIGHASREYPYVDEETKQRYALIPIEVTNEEWKYIKNAYEWRSKNRREDGVPKKSTINLLVEISAVIAYTVGFILGIILGIRVAEIEEHLYLSDASFSFSAALICWVPSFIAGSLMLGFSEIIKLLHKGGDYGHMQ